MEAPSQVVAPEGQDHLSKASNPLGELGDGKKARSPHLPLHQTPGWASWDAGWDWALEAVGTTLVTEPSSLYRDSESHLKDTARVSHLLQGDLSNESLPVPSN